MRFSISIWAVVVELFKLARDFIAAVVDRIRDWLGDWAYRFWVWIGGE